MITVWTQLVVTLCLVGLIWTVQLVHYPAFADVGEAEWRDFHALHNVRITRLVGPLMLAEAASAVVLLVRRPASIPLSLAVAGLALVVAIWASTALVSVPRHAELARSLDRTVIASLVATNWIRTVCWSLRGALAVVMATLVAGPAR